jgi:hypothetical protein
MGISVSGNYAYIAAVWGGLRIIDISDSENTEEVGSYSALGSAWRVYTSGNYAYVADEQIGLRIINISNPDNPVEAGYYVTPGRAKGVWLSGDYVYVADEECGLCILQFEPQDTAYIEEKNKTVIDEFSLNQNYPNPFSSVTTIEYSIPKRSDVNITVYNLLGQVVDVLVNQTMKPGHYSLQHDASKLGGGVYFYKIQAGSFSDMKKCVVLR